MLAAVAFVNLSCPVCDYQWQEATAGDIPPATLAKITTCPRCGAPPPMILRAVVERGTRGARG